MNCFCGIDEAGRGPLAGPVTAAAVIVGAATRIDLLGDSKALSERRRGVARLEIITTCAWAVGWASPREIDRLNILQASILAMKRALAGLPTTPSRVIVDGSYVPDLGVPTDAIVRADATVPEVMAASILAKTSRDWWMREYSEIDPRYGFEIHKGYPTKIHKELLLRHGPCRIHRLTFRPVAEALASCAAR